MTKESATPSERAEFEATVRETIGFCFEQGELQTVNADDLLRIWSAARASVSEDAARLTYIVRNSYIQSGPKGQMRIMFHVPVGPSNLREAIDAAIAARKP